MTKLSVNNLADKNVLTFSHLFESTISGFNDKLVWLLNLLH